jgi:hypothetical protein
VSYDNIGRVVERGITGLVVFALALGLTIGVLVGWAIF